MEQLPRKPEPRSNYLSLCSERKDDVHGCMTNGNPCETSVAIGTTAGMQEVEQRMEQLPRTPKAITQYLPDPSQLKLDSLRLHDTIKNPIMIGSFDYTASIISFQTIEIPFCKIHL